MEKINFQYRSQLSAGEAKASNRCQLTIGQVDDVVASVPDLVNSKFKAWHCDAVYKLGPDQFLELATQARKGKYPAKLFSALVKAALRGR
jgi:hypothetical protein